MSNEDYENLPKIVKDLYEADGVITNKAARTIETMSEVLMCVKALDMPHRDGVKILEKAGWDYSDRFDLPATEFVQRKVNKALSLINF